MRDNQNFGKISFDQINSFQQALASNFILAAEAFVDDQSLQPCSGALCQNLRERQSDSKINPKGLPTAIEFVIAQTGAVADTNIKSFFKMLAGF